MATGLLDRFRINNAYVDNVLGPYADIDALKGINMSNDRFVGLTVTVLSPVQMECWLVGSTGNSGWRVKSFAPFATYQDLITKSAVIFTKLKGMVNIGTEAVVVADETNDNKTTKYVLTGKTTTEFVWERVAAEISVTGDDMEEDNN